jgi:hypothetical protein
VALQVLTGRAALEHPGGAGEEPHLVDGGRQLFARGQRAGLAGVLALDVDELVGPRLHGVGELQQRALPLRRRGVAPVLERRRGGPHGAVDIGRAGHRRGREDLAGGGVNEVGVAAIGGRDCLPVDEVVQGALLSHSISSFH